MCVRRGWLRVCTGIPLRTSLLTGQDWAAGGYLRFRRVWLRNLQTWPYFNLAGLGLGGTPSTLEVA